MYSYLFYLIMWVVCFILVIPVLIVGVIYVLMSNKAPKKIENTMEMMFNIIKGAQTKAAFTSALEQFKGRYGVLADEKSIDLWIKCIRELANSSYWDTDAVAKFGQELEDKNAVHAKKISVAIATVLKTKN